MPVETGRHKPRSYTGDYMALGQQGETVVFDWLRRFAQVRDVVDLRAHPRMQDTDIDAVIELVGGRVVFAEIKTDEYLATTRNIAFEIVRFNHFADPNRAVTPGWTWRTTADVVFIYTPQQHQIVSIKTHDLRRAYQAYVRDARKRSSVVFIESDQGKSGLIGLVPEQYWKSYARWYNPPMTEGK